MSLQLLAKQMEAKGRKGDSMLVHMTAKEVAALQKMAESAGGSLSVNPETGLVEAFSLRNLLPAIVGGALVASGVGMPLAIAGGALTGGIQAKRDDKDFLTGALMGGLSAYGGAGLAGGLGAAGAAGAGAGAAGATAAPMTAAQGLSQAGQGIGALGSEAGRTAFMQGVGGMGGLAKAAGAVAAPMLTEEQKMAEAPVDDEMYSYTFDPGRTYAERDPSATSAERTYFQPTYRRVFSAAEGGEVADAAPVDSGIAGGMSGASKAAFDYLMGNAPTSRDPARSPLIDAQLMEGVRPVPMPVVGSDNMYAFDPATGTFLRNPNIPGAATSGSRIGTSLADFGGGYEPIGPNPDFDTPEKQAAYYAANPTMGAITRAGQTALGFLPGASALFAAQEYMDPGFRQAQENITYGISAPPSPGAGYMADNSLETGGGGWSPSENQNFGGGFDYSGDYDRAAGGSITLAEGGLMGLAKGGMKSGGFVFPADALSALGNGSTDAGLRKLNAMMGGGVTLIKGNGDGLSDSIPTNIDGKQPARVADGEAYIDPAKVKEKGGAKVLYALMDKVRKQAHGKTTQQRKVNPGKVMA